MSNSRLARRIRRAGGYGAVATALVPMLYAPSAGRAAGEQPEFDTTQAPCNGQADQQPFKYYFSDNGPRIWTDPEKARFREGIVAWTVHRYEGDGVSFTNSEMSGSGPGVWKIIRGTPGADPQVDVDGDLWKDYLSQTSCTLRKIQISSPSPVDVATDLNFRRTSRHETGHARGLRHGGLRDNRMNSTGWVGDGFGGQVSLVNGCGGQAVDEKPTADDWAQALYRSPLKRLTPDFAFESDSISSDMWLYA